MTKTNTNADKPVHFGTVSIPIAKGLYRNGNYSLILVLLYIDSRKQGSREKGYQYTFEYNAPDIHYNTGIGLKVINKHLRMLQQRGALEVMKDSKGDPIRTKQGALKYKVIKAEYEAHWGPNSRGTLLPDQQTATSDIETGREDRERAVNAGLAGPGAAGTAPEPEAAGSSKPTDGGGQPGPGADSRALNALGGGHRAPCAEASAGHSGTALSALSPGHSEPTNENEIIRKEKSSEQKENSSGSASPPLTAPASAAPSQKQTPRREKGNEPEAAEVTTGGLGKPSGSVASTPSSASPASTTDPIDPQYGIPTSYVRRYEKHADALNNYFEQHPEVGEKIEKADNAQTGRWIMHLLDVLKLD